MKKLIALFTVCAFSLLIAGMVYAAVDARTPAEKLDSGKAYLKLLDEKIIRLRKEGKTDLVAKMQQDKKSTIARMKVWKAEMEAAEAPVVAPIVPPPPPPVVARPAPAPVSTGLFGWGLKTGYTVGYLMGKSVTSLRADMILGDGIGLGSLLGLGSDTINYKIGLGGLMGNDINNRARKAIPLYVDGIINIPADVLWGVQSYLGGGLNYILYGSGSRSGSYGYQVYYGIQGDIGLGGNSYAELGYQDARSGNIGTTASYTMSGLVINIGTQLNL